MVNLEHLNTPVWRAVTITVALVAALIFGIVVLAGSDWIPGGIIVVASTVGLAREIPVIRRLHHSGS